MKIIDLELLSDILAGMDWFESLASSNDYILDEKGIRVARPLTNEYAKSACLTTAEAVQLKLYQKEIQLDLPCSIRVFLAWAERHSFTDALPENFFDYIQEHASTKLQMKHADALAVEQEVQDEIAKNRTRKTNLVKAIECAVINLQKKLDKKPNIDELWQYFEENSDQTGFVEDYTDTDLTWRDTSGKLHDCRKSTVANHLSRIKV